MAQKLKLEVVLQALDRATKPIRAITQGSVGLGRELKTTRDQLKQLKKEQFNLRFQQATGQLEKTARVKEVRREIARVKTLLAEQAKTEAEA